MLSREIGEAIVIGDIRVIVVGIKGGVVRIGVDAPLERIVLREELVGKKPLTEPPPQA